MQRENRPTRWPAGLYEVSARARSGADPKRIRTATRSHRVITGHRTLTSSVPKSATAPFSQLRSKTTPRPDSATQELPRYPHRFGASPPSASEKHK
ncbi:hypothetical protein FIBSPDRAFT_231521 [Athelia psychrophila]|uniref:Uncharacterized protein n=1 Tax=Athelia psychrophila TaxID=1759441 RepID=A0A165YLX9_9AGAM|nr:hypothetical protein FIBSPDRAFT_231521 [Fibularhizoctonia sp. CBS 109695]